MPAWREVCGFLGYAEQMYCTGQGALRPTRSAKTFTAR